MPLRQSQGDMAGGSGPRPPRPLEHAWNGDRRLSVRTCRCSETGVSVVTNINAGRVLSTSGVVSGGGGVGSVVAGSVDTLFPRKLGGDTGDTYGDIQDAVENCALIASAYSRRGQVHSSALRRMVSLSRSCCLWIASSARVIWGANSDSRTVAKSRENSS